MASYLTRIGDKQILLEAPASGAFAKSASEVDADPRTAMENMIKTIKTMANVMGKELGPTVRATGGSLEIAFAVRADGSGLVMVSESADVGQIRCNLRWVPPPRRAPGPPPQGRPRPGPPKRVGPPPPDRKG